MQLETLINLFDQTFYPSHKTRLVLAEREPLYIPRNSPSEDDQICFANRSVSSALHEIAHWCIAGAERRKLLDYGYWYIPDGRNEEQQKNFEVVEVKPQALEWIFCTAAAQTFHASFDNLNARKEVSDKERIVFEQKIYLQVLAYLKHGMPPRGLKFTKVLAEHSKGGDFWKIQASYRAPDHHP